MSRLLHNSLFGHLRPSIIWLGVTYSGVSLAGDYLNLIFKYDVLMYIATKLIALRSTKNLKPILRLLSNTGGNATIMSVPAYLKEHQEFPGYLLLAFTQAVMACISLVSCTMIIVGTITKNSKLVHPCVLITTATYAVSHMFLVFFALFSFVTGNQVGALGLMIFVICATPIQSYWNQMVYSFYKGLVKKNPLLKPEPTKDGIV